MWRLGWGWLGVWSSLVPLGSLRPFGFPPFALRFPWVPSGPHQSVQVLGFPKHTHTNRNKCHTRPSDLRFKAGMNGAVPTKIEGFGVGEPYAPMSSRTSCAFCFSISFLNLLCLNMTLESGCSTIQCTPLLFASHSTLQSLLTSRLLIRTDACFVLPSNSITEVSRQATHEKTITSRSQHHHAHALTALRESPT